MSSSLSNKYHENIFHKAQGSNQIPGKMYLQDYRTNSFDVFHASSFCTCLEFLTTVRRV